MPKGNPNPANQWKKGQSGNPSGRPKKLFDARFELSAQLLEIEQDDPEKRTKGQVMISRLIDSATKHGSIRAANEILDRLLGKPPQAILTAEVRAETVDEAILNILETNRKLAELERADNGNESGPPVQ